MIIKEFRVILPFSLAEFQIGQLYTIAHVSMNETGGGDGIEILKDEPFEENGSSGQYTHKIYHIEHKVPRFIRFIAPKGSLDIEEEAWDGFPYCKTVLTNPAYMKDNFLLSITSKHIENDRGGLENVHDLTPEQLANREVIIIDLVNEPHHYGYNEAEDPTKFKSKKTGRGPLKADYIQSHEPIMCAYKLVIAEFTWWGLQTRVENFIGNVERKIFTRLHRQMFVWMDEWIDKSLEDMRHLEEETRAKLVEQRATAGIRGTVEHDADN